MKTPDASSFRALAACATAARARQDPPLYAILLVATETAWEPPASAVAWTDAEELERTSRDGRAWVRADSECCPLTRHQAALLLAMGWRPDPAYYGDSVLTLLPTT